MFDSTIKRMYPIVKEMVDKMCSDAKDDMQHMDQNELTGFVESCRHVC